MSKCCSRLSYYSRISWLPQTARMSNTDSEHHSHIPRPPIQAQNLGYPDPTLPQSLLILLNCLHSYTFILNISLNAAYLCDSLFFYCILNCCPFNVVLVSLLLC